METGSWEKGPDFFEEEYSRYDFCVTQVGKDIIPVRTYC